MQQNKAMQNFRKRGQCSIVNFQNILKNYKGEQPNGLSVAIRFGRFPVLAPLDTQPDLGTQPSLKAFSDLWVEIVENAMINIGLVRLFPCVVHGTVKWQI